MECTITFISKAAGPGSVRISLKLADLYTGVGAGFRSRTPVESRALSWLAFARGCLLRRPPVLSAEADAASYAEVAHALGAELPYVIPLGSLQIQVVKASIYGHHHPATTLPKAKWEMLHLPQIIAVHSVYNHLV